MKPRALQQAVLPPEWDECLVNIDTEQIPGRQSLTLDGSAQDNAIAARRVDDASALREPFAMDDFQQIPDKTGHERRSEELAKLAPPLQVVGLCYM